MYREGLSKVDIFNPRSKRKGSSPVKNQGKSSRAPGNSMRVCLLECLRNRRQASVAKPPWVRGGVHAKGWRWPNKRKPWIHFKYNRVPFKGLTCIFKLLTQWTWVWASSRSWWWTGKPRVLQSMGPQRVGHDWATEQQSVPYICRE